MIRSRLCLPKLQHPPPTVLEHLVRHFPHVDEASWRNRMARGLVTTAEGRTLNEHSPYRHGMMVFYCREVIGEPAAEQRETILHQDEQILVADKPHGMPVTPVGDHVARSLMHCLQERTGIEALTPLHRLDKESAGLVMFSIKPEARAAYHELFARNAIRREYLAIASVTRPPGVTHWRIETRLVPGEPWFRQTTVEGEANAITEIDLIELREGEGLFLLRPQTGKKHQLRVHMSSIGFPIVGDRLYSESPEDQSPTLPMQLLARRLSFVDPYTNAAHHFESQNELQGMTKFKREEAFGYRSEM